MLDLTPLTRALEAVRKRVAAGDNPTRVRQLKLIVELHVGVYTDTIPRITFKVGESDYSAIQAADYQRALDEWLRRNAFDNEEAIALLPPQTPEVA